MPVVVMRGWIDPPAPGLPQWRPERDWNVQCDTRAAQTVLATGADVTLATLPATMHAQLRAAHLPSLRAAGPLGELLVVQALMHADDHDMVALASAHTGLADDLLNFRYDSVACAVAPDGTACRSNRCRWSPRPSTTSCASTGRRPDV